MGFFKKVKKYALPAIGAVLGSTILPGIGYGISALGGAAIGSGVGSGISTYSSTKNIGDALKSAGLSAAGTYAGGSIGEKLFGATGSVGNLGSVGNPGNVISEVGPYGYNLGATAANQAGAGLANASIGSVLGGAYGSEMANNTFGGGTEDTSIGYRGPTPFSPKQADAAELPASLSALGSLTDTQKSSNLANQGVYGSGIGPDEQKYFMNLLNRRLVDKGGNTSDLNTINPIERSYLSKLGLSGYANTNSLLEAMSKWSPA